MSAAALEVPTLEAYVVSEVPDTQQRVFKANPYYFKVDSSGQQLPYIDRVHERFLNADLQTLAILNGEIDFKAQGNELSELSRPTRRTRRRAATTCCCRRARSAARSPSTSPTPIRSCARSTATFGSARRSSHAINRDEMNQVLYFGLGKPEPGAAGELSFVDRRRTPNYMIDYDVDKANALLDEMGMKRGADGMRTFPDGSPVHDPVGVFEPVRRRRVRQADDRLSEGGRAQRERQGADLEATRENAKAGRSDINMEWDVPYEPTLIANVELYVPYYSDISPLFGVKWKQWHDSKGAEGEEPPDWAKKMFDIADEWKTRGARLATARSSSARSWSSSTCENMTIIGTIGALPKPVVVGNGLQQRHARRGQHGALQLRLPLSLPARPVVQGVSAPIAAAVRAARSAAGPARRERPSR